MAPHSGMGLTNQEQHLESRIFQCHPKGPHFRSKLSRGKRNGLYKKHFVRGTHHSSCVLLGQIWHHNGIIL